MRAIAMHNWDVSLTKSLEAWTSSKLLAPDGTVILQASLYADMSAVDYKALESQESQILRNIIHSEASSQDVHSWRKEEKLSDKLLKYRARFVDMQRWSETMKDNHFVA